jgi:peptide/nickel transport system ATP-binding protein/oligopeptide transport system ATP-binding protein
VATANGTVLKVEGLSTEIARRRSVARAVDDVSFTVRRGEILCIVGESGCGKTLTALSIMRLLPAAARTTGGRVLLGDQDLLGLGERAMRRVRGHQISMVFQEPMTSLDPSFTIGSQMVETVRAHSREPKAAARARSAEMLDRVGIPNATRRVDDYPHQFSGGMRQRVMLAIALLMQPKLLLADEPTTALDVTIQAQILDLILSLRDELGMSVVLITHDLGVVNEVADRAAVMYAGEIVEQGPAAKIFADPRHPYTQGLLRSIPDLSPPRSELPVIEGRVPELFALSRACRFAARCPNRITRCDEEHPALAEVAPGHWLRCFNPTPFRG